jgi:hypothetical protein
LLQPAFTECLQSWAVGKSVFVTSFSFMYSTQKRKSPFCFRTGTTGDDQGLSDSSINPRRCMSSSISPTSALLLEAASRGLADRSDLSLVYTVIHSVRPSVVIALRSKNVSVLGEELFQHMGFIATQVWPGRYNHVP